MLKTWIPGETPEKEELKQQLDVAKKKLYDLQMKIKEHKIPVLVLFEGWSAAGKGSMIGKVIKNIDPRFFKVATMSAPTEEDLRRPFLYRYFKEIPENGKFTFLDSGWMDQTCRDRMDKKLKGDSYVKRIDSIRRFERQLTDNGYVLLKFFMQIDRKEQEKRMEYLLESKDTRWRVNEYDLWQNDHYKKCRKIFDQYMRDNNSSSAPLYIIDASDRKCAELQVLETHSQRLQLQNQRQQRRRETLRNNRGLIRGEQEGELDSKQLEIVANFALERQNETDQLEKNAHVVALRVRPLGFFAASTSLLLLHARLGSQRFQQEKGRGTHSENGVLEMNEDSEQARTQSRIGECLLDRNRGQHLVQRVNQRGRLVAAEKV